MKENELTALRTRAYRDLVRFARWLGFTFGVRGHWMLDPDDVMSEALVALARCMERYLFTKPYPDFLRMARTAMRHSVGTLVYKATLTHRGVEVSRRMLSLNDSNDDCCVADSLEVQDTIPGGVEPSALYESRERMEQLASKLDSFQLRVLNALLGGDPRVARYLMLQRARKNWVYKNGNCAITVTPLVIARALNVGEAEVKQAMFRIRRELVSSEGGCVISD